MKSEHNRAFKEWAVACEAMRAGEQILIIRKGGIREERGVFEINDPEFFLMPTYEHQKARLLKAEYRQKLDAVQSVPHDLHTVTLSAFAVVDSIFEGKDDDQVNALAGDYIWNETYVKERFDFNPYDPLYLVILRVYRLPEPATIPMLPEYGGCKSWVTLAEPISTAGAVPAVPDEEFVRRRAGILKALHMG